MNSGPWAGSQPYAPDEDEQINWGKVALVFIGFAILYLATAFYFDINDNELKRTVVSTSKPYGPIKTTKNNTVAAITLTDYNLTNRWTYVETNVVNEQNVVITSFGGKFFQESGRDSEGPWSESATLSDVKITLPKPGNYYLKFTVQSGGVYASTGTDVTQNSRIGVEVSLKKGASTLYTVLGLIFLVIGVVLNEVRHRTIITMIENFTDD